jgi:PAS domain S-box-containing protein
LAFVLVQHLEPGHQRIGAKLLARAADMPVQEVRDGMRAKPNHVYVAPAQAHLSLMGELFQIVGRKAPAKHDRPIDCFFNSLAKTLKSQAIGVILSGAGSDGTAGLKSIKDEGGITLAQEPASAKFDGMPRSAIAAGCVDLILPPERIAAKLARAAHRLLVAESVAALPAKRDSGKHAGRAARRSDLSNGLGRVASAANLPIVILDRDRRIRLFSLPAQKLLGLFTGDIGRPIDKLHGVNIPDLKELISAVVEHGEEVGREVQSEEGRWYWLRITPFRTGEKKIEGVLILFVNIHALKQTQEALQKERNLISTTLGAAKDLLVVVMDREGRIVQFNRVCQQLTGYTAEEVKGRRPWDFLLLTEDTPAVSRIQRARRRNTESKGESLGHQGRSASAH